jgi:hypothetical protein
MTFLVCNPIANVLIRNGLLEGWFAEKPSRINARLQTTNLGVRSSNLFGRAIFFINVSRLRYKALDRSSPSGLCPCRVHTLAIGTVGGLLRLKVWQRLRNFPAIHVFKTGPVSSSKDQGATAAVQVRSQADISNHDCSNHDCGGILASIIQSPKPDRRKSRSAHDSRGPDLRCRIHTKSATDKLLAAKIGHARRKLVRLIVSDEPA